MINDVSCLLVSYVTCASCKISPRDNLGPLELNSRRKSLKIHPKNDFPAIFRFTRRINKTSKNGENGERGGVTTVRQIFRSRSNYSSHFVLQGFSNYISHCLPSNINVQEPISTVAKVHVYGNPCRTMKR